MEPSAAIDQVFFSWEKKEATLTYFIHSFPFLEFSWQQNRVILSMHILYVWVLSLFQGSELGLKKEVRQMLPIIVFKESFSVNDTQWVGILQFIYFLFCLFSQLFMLSYMWCFVFYTWRVADWPNLTQT